MPFSVGELLSVSRLKLELLVEGDLGRTISWVHASEMPDPSAYLQGNEVVLSAGIWYRGGSSPAEFAEGLARADVAGLGFGLSRLAPTVPPGLESACRQHSLTLFLIPDEVPFLAVIEVFVERYVKDRERPLLDAQERNEQLMQSAQQRRGIRGVLRVLERYRPGAAWVADRGRGLLAWAGEQPAAELVAAFATRSGLPDGEGSAVSGWLRFPIMATGTDAWLVVEATTDTSLSVTERGAIEQAVAFVAIELQRDLAIRESERRFAAELFDLIIAGEAQLATATARLEAFGLNPYGPLMAIVADVADTDRGIVALEQLLEDRYAHTVAAVKGLQLVALMSPPADVDWPAELGRELHTKLGEQSAIGIGGVTPDASDLRRSYLEAQQACHLAHHRLDGYTIYPEISSHVLLLALQDGHLLATFCSSLLGPLIEHDARRHTDLVHTLERFLESAGAYQSTADALHVHVNTLRGRLARIEQLTGRSLSDMEARVDLFIALRSRTRVRQFGASFSRS